MTWIAGAVSSEKFCEGGTGRGERSRGYMDREEEETCNKMSHGGSCAHFFKDYSDPRYADVDM